MLYRRGVKYPEKIVNHTKSCTTIMMCGSADGTVHPPYVVYKSEHLYNTWKQGGMNGELAVENHVVLKAADITEHPMDGWMPQLLKIGL